MPDLWGICSLWVNIIETCSLNDVISHVEKEQSISKIIIL